MSNNIYDILGKLKNLQPTETPVETAKQPIYESVDAKGDIMEAVKSLEEKYMGFKKTVAAVKKGGSAEDPEAVAAAIGRKKYGKKAFQKAAAAGKKMGESKEEYCDACDSTKCHCDVNEAAKPDFLDLDKDGDTEEPMKSAAKDAKEHEPAKVDKSAVEKRKRLQALKDRQEDERAEKGDYDSKSSTRVVKGRAYGGAAQKDDADDLDESGLQAYLGKKKYGEEGMKALQKAGREGASKEKMALLRAKHDKMDEVAPPGAKAERMVKHIKKGYAKDGKLTKREKGIAYATAWKAHNKGQVEEGVEFGDTIENSSAELKSAEKLVVKESRSQMMEGSSYTYELVADILSAEQPGLDVNSTAFEKAVYDELIKMHLSPKAARWNVYYDEDFLSDTATAYEHNLKQKAAEVAELSMNTQEPLLDATQELDEIARLAGLPVKTCEACDCNPCKCDESAGCSMEELDEAATRKDFRMVANLIKANPNREKAKELAHHHADIFKQQNPRFKKDMFLAACGLEECGMTPATVIVGEEEVDEGNEFTKARLDAIAAGKDSFTVGGKTYNVSGDTSQERQQVEEAINVTVNATADDADGIHILQLLSGLTAVADDQPQPQEPVAQPLEQPLEQPAMEERDIEYANTPEEKTAPLSAAIPSGTDLNRSKRQDPHTANKAANPLGEEKVEESLWASYESMLNDIKA